MKFAMFEGERREAQPSLTAKCPVCENAMIAKCGELRVWHWAHKGMRKCDHWWEPETPWHREWKDHFPKAWQEIIQISEGGEKHIADVKTERGVVLEFQHSPLKCTERQSREAFYKHMVWIVDARRRVSDLARFAASLNAAIVVSRTPHIVSAPSDDCALLRDWGASRMPVYLDFGEAEPADATRAARTPVLWRLSPLKPGGNVYLSPVPKTWFVKAYLEGVPFEELHAKAEREVAYRLLIRQSSQPVPLKGFQRFVARRERARRRF